MNRNENREFHFDWDPPCFELVRNGKTHYCPLTAEQITQLSRMFDGDYISVVVQDAEGNTFRLMPQKHASQN